MHSCNHFMARNLLVRLLGDSALEIKGLVTAEQESKTVDFGFYPNDYCRL